MSTLPTTSRNTAIHIPMHSKTSMYRQNQMSIATTKILSDKK